MLVFAALVSAVVISHSNFSQATEGYMNALVLFYSPFCGHCQAYKPDWNSFTKSYENELGLLLGEVNCIEERRLCSDYVISGYPTVKYINLRNKYHIEVPGPHPGDQTQEILKKVFEGQTFEYKSFEDVQKFAISRYNTFVLKYDKKDSEYQNYLTATDSYKSAKATFAVVPDKKLSLTYYEKENLSNRLYKGDFSMTDIANFIKSLIHRSIPDIDFKLMKENSEIVAFLYDNQTTKQYYNNISLRLPPFPIQAIAEFPCLYKPFKSLKYTDIPCISYVRTKTGEITLFPGNQSDVDSIAKWINAQSSRITYENKSMLIFCLIAIVFVVTLVIISSYVCSKSNDENNNIDLEYLQEISVESI